MTSSSPSLIQNKSRSTSLDQNKTFCEKFQSLTMRERESGSESVWERDRLSSPATEFAPALDLATPARRVNLPCSIRSQLKANVIRTHTQNLATYQTPVLFSWNFLTTSNVWFERKRDLSIITQHFTFILFFFSFLDGKHFTFILDC